MADLSPGAVELPPAHLSVRVPWHDTDWTGRVCERPDQNQSCTVLKNIKEKKRPELESELSGKGFTDLSKERTPPCVTERVGFMRPAPYSIPRDHAYSGGWTRSHAHFTETRQQMPAYSFEATPFRWVMREQAPRYCGEWGIEYDEQLEAQADRHIETKRPTAWVQDHRNQLALLDSFFSGVRAGESLVFVYLKDMPLLEEREPGARILLGVGRVTDVHRSYEWATKGKGPVRSIMWERGVSHSIRPEFDDGFLLPYHRTLDLSERQGIDVDELVARAPADHFDEFSYVSERVGDDAAIAALVELARVVELLPDLVDGPWLDVRSWLAERIDETWDSRGPYPGLGSALKAAGFDRGPLIAARVAESLDGPERPLWPALDEAIELGAANRGPAARLLGRHEQKLWAMLGAKPERLELLKLLSRFALSGEQASRVFRSKGRSVTDRELLLNPYLIYEIDRQTEAPIGLSTIDRGLLPQNGAAQLALREDELSDPVTASGDERRVRAAATMVLEHAAEQGHTVLDEAGLRRRLADLELKPICDPSDEEFELAVEEFAPVLGPAEVRNEDEPGWQLERIQSAGALIRERIEALLAVGPRDDVATEPETWRNEVDELLDEPLPEQGSDDHSLEAAAREEKAEALATLAGGRVVALIGRAGTGKTTLLKGLVQRRQVAGRVLLLAPTGKARVQLGDRVGAPAQTIAQFLRAKDRWDPLRGYHLNRDGMRVGGFDTVIIDEASMLTEEMLAAVLESVKDPGRLVLCGDHRQLPPIGAGRPFSDLIKRLRDQPDSAGGIATLEIPRRHRSAVSGARPGGARDDMAIAALFAADQTPAGADQALNRVLGGESDGTVRIERWSTEADLHERLVEILAADDALGLEDRTTDALKRSLGADQERNGRPSFEFGRGGAGAEAWQLLSPVRARPGGTVGLNGAIRDTWRPGDLGRAFESRGLPDPAGADQVLFHDKVMCLVNRKYRARRYPEAVDEDAYIANGEIGMAVGWPGAAQAHWVEFSTQPGLQFTFWLDKLNSGSDTAQEMLELAYAVTIHKAQGSQFERTFVVIPNPCPLLSPELLYTALTRHRSNTTVFVQGDPVELLALTDPARSETARRLTCLFEPPDPFTTPEGRLLDGSHVHRSANGELMRSKSEVIVANTLRSLDVDYDYEQLLEMEDGSVREPDFTIRRPGAVPIYWEHLGMLDRAGYRADWEAKLQWYRSHDIRPLEEGGGSAGVLVWSEEGRGRPGSIRPRSRSSPRP